MAEPLSSSHLSEGEGEEVTAENPTEEPQEQEGETVVVIAGRPSSGKSTLNNIFGVKFESKNSVNSVTPHIECKKVTKEGSTVIVVDTPGLGAADLKMDTVEDEFASVVGNLNYTFLYCHSVGPNSKLMDVDIRIVKNLQKVLGKQIWKKCIILFTFSDTLRRDDYAEYREREDYLNYLQEHARLLTEMLKRHCGKHVPMIKLVTDITVDYTAKVEEIVAVPVGRKVAQRREEEVLIPGPDGSGRNWWVVAWNEIFRKSTKLDQVLLKKVASNSQTMAALAVSLTTGIALGGLGGAVFGAVAGGFGAIPGACVGAFLGGLAAGVGGTSVGQVIIAPHVKATKKKARADKLRSAEFVETSAADRRPGGQEEVVSRDDLVNNSYISSDFTQSLPSDADLRRRQQHRRERPLQSRIFHQYDRRSPFSHHLL